MEVPSGTPSELTSVEVEPCVCLSGEFSSFPKEDCEYVLLRSQRLSCEAEMCWEMGFVWFSFFFHITQKGFKKSFGSCNQPHISMLHSE